MSPLTPKRSRRSAFATAVAVFGVASLSVMYPAYAGATTPSGTQIQNTATASYSDGTNTYSTQSNSVTTTVQNAPSETIVAGGAQSVTDNQAVTDSYTLTNTGNGVGYFQFPGTQGTNDGVTGGTGAVASTNTYNVTVGAGTTQTGYTLTQLNNYLLTGNPATSSGGTAQTVPGTNGGAATSANQVVVTVNYQVGSADTAAQTIITSLGTTITQTNTANGATAQTSTVSNASETDTVFSDARLDVQKTASVGGTAAAPTVTYTVNFANGGNYAMTSLFTNALPAGTNSCAAGVACGIFLDDVLPSSPTAAVLPSALTASTAISKNYTAGDAIYYYVSGAWTATYSNTATRIGVFVPAANIAIFAPNNNVTSTNTVSNANAVLQLTFTVTGSTASGSGNSTYWTNISNGVFGDHANYVEGPGIPVGTVANNASTTSTSATTALAQTSTPTTDSGSTQSAAAPAAGTVLNGPSGFPAATGSDGTTATDYTFKSYIDGGGGAANNIVQTGTLTGGAGAPIAIGANASRAPIIFTNTIQNTGNASDIYNLTDTGFTVPTGWTVQIENAASSAVITSLTVASGATGNYTIVVTPPTSATSATSFVKYAIPVTATSTNTPAQNNVTNDQFMVGGYVQMTKAFTVAPGIPCTTATAGNFVTQTTALPNDCVLYTVSYTNMSSAPGPGANDVSLAATSFVITEDGSASGTTDGIAYTNSWFTYSLSGLYAAPVDSNGGTFVYSPTAGTAPGSSKFTDTVATLAAGATGNVAFKIQVK